MIRYLTLVALSVSLVGCGRSDLPPMGAVTGTVMLDGSPVEGGSLEFIPEDGGRPSMGRTNAKGEYELLYAPDVKGAMVGKAKIRFEMASSTGPASEEDMRKPPGVKKQLPKDLKISPAAVEIAAGQNVFNLKLEK